MDDKKLKYCYKCNQWLPKSKFSKKCNICKKCSKEYRDTHKNEIQEYRDNHKKEKAISDKAYRNKHKKEIQAKTNEKYNEFKLIYNNLKINGCAICDSYIRLVFHHNNGEDKLFNISNGCNYSNDSITNELNKCTILCRKCHRKLHRDEK